jgi:hypothetical protein
VGREPRHLAWGRLRLVLGLLTVARTTITIRPTQEQAERWRAAAQYDGARSVGTWLASLAAERLRYLGRYVPRMPLVWRPGRFRLRKPDGSEGEEVAGIVAGPFGVSRNDESFTLTHVPTGCRLATLTQQRRCKFLARELAGLRVDWKATDPEAVNGPDMRKAWDAIYAARRSAYPDAHPISIAGTR